LARDSQRQAIERRIAVWQLTAEEERAVENLTIAAALQGALKR
jgi:hypothetical protein